MNPQLATHGKEVLDTAIASVAISAPWWVQYHDLIQNGVTFITAIGGIILLLLRIGVAWREWRKGRKKLAPCKAEPPRDYNQ